MLVLSRKQDQEIVIGDNVKITVLNVKGNTVRLGIDAPREVRIVRGELAEQPAAPATHANITVVFNDPVEPHAEPSVEIVPFKSPQREGSISYKGRIPESLSRNRLQSLVDELTASRGSSNE